MDIWNMCYTGGTLPCTLGKIFLLTISAVAKGVTLTPCGNDGVVEVTAGQKTYLSCSGEKRVDWMLRFQGSDTSDTLALCNENSCSLMGLFHNTFNATAGDRQHTLVINAGNDTEIYNNVNIVNGSLTCTGKKENSSADPSLPTSSSSCNLNYVSVPENVSCSAVKTTGSVNVSCVIASVYSSRRIYRCQLLRVIYGPKNGSLENITMVTSPTNETIAKNEVKVSGFCHFDTAPPQARHHNFYVSISPGGQTYPVTFTADDDWTTTVSQPHLTQPCESSYQCAVEVAAAVTAVVVFAIVLLVTGFVIKKKRRDGRRENEAQENPQDTQDTDSRQDPTAVNVYDTPWDAVTKTNKMSLATTSAISAMQASFPSSQEKQTKSAVKKSCDGKACETSGMSLSLDLTEFVPADMSPRQPPSALYTSASLSPEWSKTSGSTEPEVVDCSIYVSPYLDLSHSGRLELLHVHEPPVYSLATVIPSKSAGH